MPDTVADASALAVVAFELPLAREAPRRRTRHPRHPAPCRRARRSVRRPPNSTYHASSETWKAMNRRSAAFQGNQVVASCQT